MGKTISTIQTISSRARKVVTFISGISDGIRKLQKNIAEKERKLTNKQASYGYIQYPSTSISGLQLLFFEEGLVRLFHLIAETKTFYFDASGSFVSAIPAIKNKDRKAKRIFLYALMVKNHEGKSPPVAIFEHVITDHNIIAIRQPFLRSKDMETRLFGFSISPARVVTDFSKAIIQAVLQEYTNETIGKYLSRLYRIATGVSSDEENKKTHVHICSFHFLKLNRQILGRLYGKIKEQCKKHFCLRILGRLICCGSLKEAIRIWKHASIIMTNKKVTSAVKQSLSILQETINKSDILQGIENDAGTCLTEENENDSFGDVS